MTSDLSESGLGSSYLWLPDRLSPCRANKNWGEGFVIASGLCACGFISFMQIGLSLPQMIFFPVVLHAGSPES